MKDRPSYSGYSEPMAPSRQGGRAIRSPHSQVLTPMQARTRINKVGTSPPSVVGSLEAAMLLYFHPVMLWWSLGVIKAGCLLFFALDIAGHGQEHTSPVTTTAFLSSKATLFVETYLCRVLPFFREMSVNLDQIEFYHGPSRQSLSTSIKQLPPAHAPRPFQHSFSTGFAFPPGPCGGPPLGQEPPLGGTTHQWNIFDVEINNVYGFTRPQTTQDVEPAVTENMPTVHDTPLDLGNSPLAVSGPEPLKGSATPISCPARSDHPDHVPPDMRKNDLPGKLAQHFDVQSWPTNSFCLTIFRYCAGHQGSGDPSTLVRAV